MWRCMGRGLCLSALAAGAEATEEGALAVLVLTLHSTYRRPCGYKLSDEADISVNGQVVT
jgi:hypothetical protein